MNEFEIANTEVKRMMDSGDEFQFIDVREPSEHAFCNLGATLLPVGDVLSNLDAISRTKTVVMHCKAGSRSGKLVTALRQRGFQNIWSMRGGIEAWSLEIDSSIPLY